MKLILIQFIFLITSSSSNKIIFICGDHECIDKKEAKEYFTDFEKIILYENSFLGFLNKLKILMNKKFCSEI